jgi:hypothetical protein
MEVDLSSRRRRGEGCIGLTGGLGLWLVLSVYFNLEKMWREFF